VSANDYDFRLESALLQASGEGLVCPGRPDSQNTARAEGGKSAIQTGFVVEAIIGLPGKAFRTVVDIQKYGIPGVFFPPDGLPHIAFFHGYPGIVQRHSGKVPQVIPIPPNHSRDQFVYGDACIGRGMLECRRQGVAHAKAADENPQAGLSFHTAAGELCQRIFGPMKAAVHQLCSCRSNREVSAPFQQGDVSILAGDFGPVNLFPGDHNRLLNPPLDSVICMGLFFGLYPIIVL
jgi:hypothetical protein